MKSAETTVSQYLASLPPERRKVVAAVRSVIKRNLPKGYVEGMDFGMISYAVPLSVFPETYNGRPLAYAALAAQKNYYALHLMGIYGDPAAEASLREAFRKAGKRLDMGKSCVRFRSLEDLPLEVIGTTVAGMPVSRFVQRYRDLRSR